MKKEDIKSLLIEQGIKEPKKEAIDALHAKFKESSKTDTEKAVKDRIDKLKTEQDAEKNKNLTLEEKVDKQETELNKIKENEAKKEKLNKDLAELDLKSDTLKESAIKMLEKGMDIKDIKSILDGVSDETIAENELDKELDKQEKENKDKPTTDKDKPLTMKEEIEELSKDSGFGY